MQKANRQGQRWTESEKKQVKKGFKAGKNAEEIADSLERSVGGVENQSIKLALDELLNQCSFKDVETVFNSTLKRFKPVALVDMYTVLTGMVQHKIMTGLEILPKDEAYETALSQRRAKAVAKELKSRQERYENSTSTVCNSGKPWLEQDDANLLKGLKNELSFAVMAQQHRRTELSIKLRAAKHAVEYFFELLTAENKSHKKTNRVMDTYDVTVADLFDAVSYISTVELLQRLCILPKVLPEGFVPLTRQQPKKADDIEITESTDSSDSSEKEPVKVTKGKGKERETPKKYKPANSATNSESDPSNSEPEKVNLFKVSNRPKKQEAVSSCQFTEPPAPKKVKPLIGKTMTFDDVIEPLNKLNETVVSANNNIATLQMKLAIALSKIEMLESLQRSLNANK